MHVNYRHREGNGETGGGLYIITPLAFLTPKRYSVP